MLRYALTTVAFSGVLFGTAASAQSITEPSAIDAEFPNQICIAARRTVQTISIGRGRNRIEVSLGGGACEPPGSGISDLWARFPADDSKLDAVLAKTCPAFQIEVSKLWSARPRRTRLLHPVNDVRVGPFVVAGRTDLFDLESARGRRAAAQWIRRMLAEVQPCWNNFREDRTREVVQRLYATLTMSPR